MQSVLASNSIRRVGGFFLILILRLTKTIVITMLNTPQKNRLENIQISNVLDESLSGKSATYLVCILDWGLGHATRCMPIIETLLAKGHRVHIASDGQSLALLKKEFPNLSFFELPSYGITYRYQNMLLNMALQSPSFFRAQKKEHKVIQDIVNQHDINIIVSDNRYGCYSSKVSKNIFVTHQINIKTGNRWLDGLARWVNHALINRFDALWIPDVAHEPSLAGELSHGYEQGLPPMTYIGHLSRMKKLNLVQQYDIAVVLSGPEPQRTYLEQTLIAQLRKLPQRSILIRGLPKENQRYMDTPMLEIVSHMTARELNEVICQSALIVCRSGYTTVMDLEILNKKVLMIPTPGQIEQEYLADRLAKQGKCMVQTQDKVDLAAALLQ